MSKGIQSEGWFEEESKGPEPNTGFALGGDKSNGTATLADKGAPTAIVSGISMKGVVEGLMKSGGWTMLVKTASSGTESFVGSALGRSGGSVASNAVSGMGTGLLTSVLLQGGLGGGAAGGLAVAAAAVSGPLLALGVVAGGLVGLFQGFIDDFKQKDQAFQSYVKQQYEAVTTGQRETLERGITLAAADDQSYSSIIEIRQGLQDQMDGAMGRGFLRERQEGVERQNEWLAKQCEEGGLGDAYSLIGSFQASLENKKEELERDALDMVMGKSLGAANENYQKEDGSLSEAGERLRELSEQYQALMELSEQEPENSALGAKMGALLAEAQVIAANEYNASEGARLLEESNLALIGHIREDSALKVEYYDTGYEMGEEFSKGLVNAQAKRLGEKVNNVFLTWFSRPDMEDVPAIYDYNYEFWNGAAPAAYGMNQVPRDNFPALLHKGERVLTASQARQADGKGKIQVTVTGNQFYGSDEAMEERVARRIAREVQRAVLLGNGE